MSRCVEGRQFHCPYKSAKNGRLVPVVVNGAGDKTVCTKAYDNGKDHPKVPGNGAVLLKSDVCKRTLRLGSCKRWGDKTPPSGLKVK